jgi:hypothetical protein
LKRLYLIFLISFSLLITGCTPAHTTSGKEKKDEKVISKPKIDEVGPVTTYFDNKYVFTYLEGLPVNKLEKFNLFLKDGNINHLTDFTPEQIVLIYMNLVLEHKVDKLYALTYDNGHLPSLEVFNNEYDGYLSGHLEEDYLKYRFYDSIKVSEKTRKKEELVVQMEIIFGSQSQIVAYGLRKERDVWKLDLYPLLERAKKMNN